MTVPAKASARAHVLVVEDSSVFREMQTLLLGQAGYVVSGHENPQTALAEARKQPFDMVVIDYELPEMNGEQFMHELRKLQPEIPVIFVSGSLTLELAIQLSSQGVAGIFNKPANPKTLLEKINETLARHAARDTAARVGSGSPHSAPPRRGKTRSPFSNHVATAAEPAADRLAYRPRFMMGSSDKFREFTHRLWKVRDFRAVLLLLGETGSPFELLARELAEISIFRDGPIMVCDVDRFEPRGLIEVLAPSLLSHDAGTLVVTGVETFSAEQQKTLENLMTGRDVFLPFARRFRLVLAATSALSDRVDDGTFGETLYYKVSSLSVSVPSLREMRSDIVANAERILALHREAGNADGPLTLAQDAANWVKLQDWPGNYDELAHTILTAIQGAAGAELTLDALAASLPHDENSPAVIAPELRAAALTADEHPPGEARPPFPLASDLAADAVVARPAKTPAPVPPPAPAAPVFAPATSAPEVARAPAGKLFSPNRPLTAQSLFRPVSGSYDFGKRLVDSLAAADAGGSH